MPRYNATAPQQNGAAFVLHDHENFLWTKKCLLPYISVICRYLTLPIYYYHPHDLLFQRGSFIKLNGKSGPYLAEGDASGCFCKLEVPDN